MPIASNHPHFTDQGEDAISKEMREALFSQNENTRLSILHIAQAESDGSPERPFFADKRSWF